MKRILALLTALLLCLPLAGCGGAGDSAETPAPEESTPVESGLPGDGEKETPAPVKYDFSDAEIDEYTRTLTGFEGLPWGYRLPQMLVEDLGSGEEGLTLRKNAVQFAGLSFQTCYFFYHDPGIRDLEEGAQVLIAGYYNREGYYTYGEMQRGTAMIVEDFNRVLAYLTELYGTAGALLGSGHGDGGSYNGRGTVGQRILRSALVWNVSADTEKRHIDSHICAPAGGRTARGRIEALEQRK